MLALRLCLFVAGEATTGESALLVDEVPPLVDERMLLGEAAGEDDAFPPGVEDSLPLPRRLLPSSIPRYGRP